MEREGAGRPAVGGRVAVAPGLGSMAICCVLLAGGTGLLAGCASSAAREVGVGTTCGSTHTAANVPIIVKVTKGTVNCGVAMQVENEYAAMISAGKVPGTGGGAPVTVRGWTCQGYSTPEVLSTGNASQCHTSSAAIVAVLPVPTPSAMSKAR